MSDPPPQYAAYPRQSRDLTKEVTVNDYGTVEKFEAVTSSYFGVDLFFGANVIATLFCIVPFTIADFRVGLVFVFLLTSLFAVFLRGAIKKISFALGWTPAQEVKTWIWMIPNPLFAGGLIGYLFLKWKTFEEVKRYEVPGQFGNVNQNQVRKMIARRKAPPMVQPPVAFIEPPGFTK